MSVRPYNPENRRADFFVTLLCLAGTVFWLLIFWQDLNSTLARLNDQPVGTITYKYKAAQRRFIDRVLWDRLQKQSPVYNGDFIRTAELSEATISFSGGRSIDLAENSLIQIRFEGELARIDLTEGGVSVSARGDSSFALASGESRVDVGPGGIVSAAAEGEAFTLRVVEGSASVVNARDGTTRQAEAGEMFSLAGTAAAGPQIVVLSPRPNARVLSPERTGLPVAFTWRSANYSAEDYTRLEIAEDRGFTRILMTLAATDGNTASAPLSAGVYFWRAYPVRGAAGSGDAEAAASGKLTVVYAPRPRPITPAEDYVYHYRTRFPAIRFQWTQQEEASYYVVEAADNPAMTNPALQTQARGASFVYSGLAAGRWYWRVRPVYPQGYEGAAEASEPGPFIIEKSGDLSAPHLLAPAANAAVNIADNREDIYFSWNSDAEAASYTLVISSGSDLRSPVITRTVRDNFFLYGRRETILRSGQYYWGVYQTDAEGNSSPVSPARPFLAIQGEVIQRTVFPPDNYTVAGEFLPDTRFTWKTNLPFQTRFQVSREQDFSGTVINEAAVAEVFQGRILPEGVYYWRVTSSSTQEITFSTQAKRLTVAPPLPAPLLEEPALGARMTTREGVPALFRWRPVAGAEYYQLRLYSEGVSSPVYNISTETASQSIRMDSLPEGNYRWTVQAFVTEGLLTSRRIGLLSAGNFVMRKLQPVTLDYPASGREYPGMEALRRPDTLRWSSKENPPESRFVLSRSPAMEGQAAMNIRNPQRKITLRRLPQGTYYWTIRAETEDGFDISAEKPSSFKVLPIPPLPETPRLLPQDNYLLGPEELRRNRTLSFSWRAVEGANNYIFTLFRETPEGQRQMILQNKPSEKTSWTLEDLKVLLVQGNFIWQVEAVYSEQDGIIQRGTIGENRFTVNVPLPGQPRPDSPGILYGR
ncbi:MAG: FecR family protein [Spirochaetales bacterium]|nr:FecR family protein [Spirochaetales bacterium]